MSVNVLRKKERRECEVGEGERKRERSVGFRLSMESIVSGKTLV